MSPAFDWIANLSNHSYVRVESLRDDVLPKLECAVNQVEVGEPRVVSTAIIGASNSRSVRSLRKVLKTSRRIPSLPLPPDNLRCSLVLLGSGWMALDLVQQFRRHHERHVVIAVLVDEKSTFLAPRAGCPTELYRSHR
jgi:hypothetical protein